MAYTALTWVSGEVVTAAKMNLLSANDASFRDGTGFLDNSIQLSKIASDRGETACFRHSNSDTTYPSGNTVSFGTQVYNNTNGVVSSNSSGIITVTGNKSFKISGILWINAATNARPWVKIINHGTGATLVDCINDSSSGYVSVQIPGVVILHSTTIRLKVVVNSSAGDIKINAGSGNSCGTFITVELLE